MKKRYYVIDVQQSEVLASGVCIFLGGARVMARDYRWSEWHFHTLEDFHENILRQHEAYAMLFDWDCEDIDARVEKFCPGFSGETP
ncbi:MAG: hypothetical protein ACSHWQ_01460 [Spongiibacteraceae bacterium]